MNYRSGHRRWKTAVAIPARDEADRVLACLKALDAQQDGDGRALDMGDVAVLLLVNNSRDATAERARTWARDHRLNLVVREADLPDELAHAGGARRAAMDWALEQADGEGILCSTDADSQVGRAWLSTIWTAFQSGVDAVAGTVAFDAKEAAGRCFSPLRRMEDQYAALQAEVIARLDPEPHNPWPNHIWTWGANLAVTAAAYRAVGGLPREPLAEDRALAAALRRQDRQVRHALEVCVLTSPRDQGRAPGGLADLVRLYGEDDDYPCDAELEPILTAAMRAAARRHFRRLWSRGGKVDALARRLALSPSRLADVLTRSWCGEGWAEVELLSLPLERRRLRPKHLPLEIARAERLLRRLRPSDATNPADISPAVPAGLWSGEVQPAG